MESSQNQEADMMASKWGYSGL